MTSRIARIRAGQVGSKSSMVVEVDWYGLVLLV